MVDIHRKIIERTDNRPNARFLLKRAGYITIHMTGNRGAGADAAAHAQWVFDAAPYSWHFTVDDHEVWQHLEEWEQGWHAGDGDGPGNKDSIGIEICMNEGIVQWAAYENAAWLVRDLLARGHGKRGIVQHNHWSGKNCPELIRAEPGRWEKFLAQVEEGDMPDPRLDEVIAALGGIDEIRKWNTNGNSLLVGYALEQAEQDATIGGLTELQTRLNELEVAVHQLREPRPPTPNLLRALRDAINETMDE